MRFPWRVFHRANIIQFQPSNPNRAPRLWTLDFGLWTILRAKTSQVSALRSQSFYFFNLRDLRQRHCAADGMTEKRAGVNRLAARRRPRGIHQIRATDAGGKRKAAGQRFAETNQIGNHAGVFAREPFSGATEAGVNFVEDEQRAEFVAKFSEQRQKFVWRNIAAAARLNWLD